VRALEPQKGASSRRQLVRDVVGNVAESNQDTATAVSRER
jgi:hypothetical protein